LQTSYSDPDNNSNNNDANEKIALNSEMAGEGKKHPRALQSPSRGKE